VAAGPTTPTTPTWGPLVGWLVTLAAFVVMLAVAVGGSLPWAVVPAPGAALRYLDGTGLVDNALVPLPLLSVTVVVTFAGLVAAPLFGMTAVPGARWGRWLVTAVLLALLGTAVVAGLADAADQAARGYGVGDPYTETITILVLVFALPTLLLLLLTWRARRGAAITAAVLAVAAALAHVATLVMLVVYPPRVAEGAWIMLLAVLLSAAGALLQARTTPRTPRRAPAPQPGDPGWTA
jgi:hypothetical protein